MIRNAPTTVGSNIWTYDTTTYQTTSSYIRLKKGHVRLAVRGIKIPDGLAVMECECTDTRSLAQQKREGPQPHDLRLFVRKEIQYYLDDKRIYTYTTSSGIAMDPKELAILLLKFK